MYDNFRLEYLYASSDLLNMQVKNADWYTFDSPQFSVDCFVKLWLLALAFYGVGDIVTTVAIVWFSPLYVEANPVINQAISVLGGGGLLSIKLIVFYTAIGVSLWGGFSDDDRVLFYAPPVVLAVLGATATISNMALLM